MRANQRSPATGPVHAVAYSSFRATTRQSLRTHHVTDAQQVWWERRGERTGKWWFIRLIQLFAAGRAVKQERRKGSSRRQQTAYGAANNEVAHELLWSARSPKRENGGRRYIRHDRTIASPVGSCLCCWQRP